VTFRKPIAADHEANLKAVPRKQRAMIRKGIEAGLESTLTDDVDRLFRTYSASVRNLGTPIFPAATSGCCRRSSAPPATVSSSPTRVATSRR